MFRNGLRWRSLRVSKLGYILAAFETGFSGSEMKAAVYLQKTKQNAIRRGHPWVFPKAINKINGKVLTGGLVDVYDAEGKPLGTGVYNEHSLYRVRVLTQSWENIDTASIAPIIAHRLKQALSLRKTLNLPNDQTTAYRLFNSEADGLSGLTIDRFNQVAVVSSSAYWVEANKLTIIHAIEELLPGEEIVWLAQGKPLAQDGWTEKSEPSVAKTAKVLEADNHFSSRFFTSTKNRFVS